jgi:hypothetical protein
LLKKSKEEINKESKRIKDKQEGKQEVLGRERERERRESGGGSERSYI